WHSMVGGGTLVTVDLSPLSPVDARSIARRFIDVSAFADQCVERAGGNPLFLEQLLRGAGDLTDGRLPASIQSVVLARTDLLSVQDRRAIQAASVLGQRFSLAHLRALLQEPQYDCGTLVRNVLVRRTRDGLQFATALIRPCRITGRFSRGRCFIADLWGGNFGFPGPPAGRNFPLGLTRGGFQAPFPV